MHRRELLRRAGIAGAGGDILAGCQDDEASSTGDGGAGDDSSDGQSNADSGDDSTGGQGVKGVSFSPLSSEGEDFNRFFAEGVPKAGSFVRGAGDWAGLESVEGSCGLVAQLADQ